METEEKKPIHSFRDLNVYRRSYDAMLCVVKDIIPALPQKEKYDLQDQLLRSSKAVPRLIAEGYAKRHQHAGFQKYIDDAMAESNETSASLEQCRDLYGECVRVDLCDKLIAEYDILGRQLYQLRLSWKRFEDRQPK